MGSAATVLTLLGDRVPLAVPRAALTHGGFRAWIGSGALPDGLRASFIEGEVLLDMNAEAIHSHGKVKLEIARSLATIVAEEDLGELHPDGTLLTNVAAGVSTEPDLCFVSYAAIAGHRVRYVKKARRDDDEIEIEGTPDMVLEVISDSSVQKDEVRLRAAYARAGIPEYWLVDARGESIRFEILVLRGGVYRRARTSRVFGRAFVLRRARNRVGRWSYRLDVVARAR